MNDGAAFVMQPLTHFLAASKGFAGFAAPDAPAWLPRAEPRRGRMRSVGAVLGFSKARSHSLRSCGRQRGVQAGDAARQHVSLLPHTHPSPRRRSEHRAAHKVLAEPVEPLGLPTPEHNAVVSGGKGWIPESL